LPPINPFPEKSASRASIGESRRPEKKGIRHIFPEDAFEDCDLMIMFPLPPRTSTGLKNCTSSAKPVRTTAMVEGGLPRPIFLQKSLEIMPGEWYDGQAFLRNQLKISTDVDISVEK
jgi:hypothetical protein